MRLIDADKLIRKLKWLSTQRWLEHAKSNASGMLNDVQDVVNMQPTVDPWHYPSKGELPTVGIFNPYMSDKCFVAVNGAEKHTDMAYYDFKEKGWVKFITPGREEWLDVYAWMPLPEVPEDLKQ